MLKRIISITVCIMLLTTIVPFVTLAGDENNPEIEDPEGDVLLFGKMPMLIMSKFFKHIDVISAWFYENPDEPDILYTTLKIKEYKRSLLMAAYGIFWYYNDIDYGAISMFSRGEDYMIGIQIQEVEFIPVDNFYTIDEEKNTVTFAIPKNLIGNPEPGDILNPFISIGVMRFVSDTLSNILMRSVGTNVLAADFTTGGLDYTIQY